VERLSEGNELLCEHCHEKEQCTKQLNINRYPPVLVLHLKRFKALTRS